jgi:hypothetical protein
MIRNVLLAAVLACAIAFPASALPPPDYQAAAQSEELRFNPVADLATADVANVAIVDDNRASTSDRPALAYEAALFFELSADGMPLTAIGAFAPIDPGRPYIA